jgi:hypothetical protein
MAKQKKVPGQATSRPTGKNVRIQESSQRQHPTWRFSTVDCEGPFAWPKNTATELEILQKLHEYDSQLWSEIEGSRSHAIQLSSLSRDAKRRLEEIQQDDIEEVFSFRITGACRVFGIRDSGTVKLLWYDPDHGVCPSKLKRT